MTTKSPLRDAAREAFLYALPLTEIANARAALLGSGVPAGRFFLQRGLATPKDRFVTTPNVDTIYANVFIDLTGGPATIVLPPFGDRYGSLSLMDMFSDNVAVLGTRTTGQDGGTFTLIGPRRPRAVWPWEQRRRRSHAALRGRRPRRPARSQRPGPIPRPRAWSSGSRPRAPRRSDR